MERSFRALIATALLTLVHGQVPVVQGTNPSSQIQAADEVDALVRQVLADRIAAKDIPDFGLLLGAKRIAVRSDGIGGLALGKDALPALEGYDLRLISTGEAQAEAERTQDPRPLHSHRRISRLARDTAGLWIGVDYTMPTGSRA